MGTVSSNCPGESHHLKLQALASYDRCPNVAWLQPMLWLANLVPLFWTLIKTRSWKQMVMKIMDHLYLIIIDDDR